MKQEKLVDILVLIKRMGNLLIEVSDISAQLAEAIDRQDEMTMNMVISMRYEPIEKLAIADQALREQLEELGIEDANHMRALLSGDESAARDEMEAAIAAQAASSIRMHQKVLEQDKILNRKIARDKSIYQ